MVQVRHLVGVAGYGGLAILISSSLMYRRLQQKAKDSIYYQSAISLLGRNDMVKEALGEPLEFGSVDLRDKLHYITDQGCTFNIPVRGSKDQGEMLVKGYCSLPEIRPHVTSIVLDITSAGESYLVYEKT